MPDQLSNDFNWSPPEPAAGLNSSRLQEFSIKAAPQTRAAFFNIFFFIFFISFLKR
jgi:hypothetical protein